MIRLLDLLMRPDTPPAGRNSKGVVQLVKDTRYWRVARSFGWRDAWDKARRL